MYMKWGEFRNVGISLFPARNCVSDYPHHRTLCRFELTMYILLDWRDGVYSRLPARKLTILGLLLSILVTDRISPKIHNRALPVVRTLQGGPPL